VKEGFKRWTNLNNEQKKPFIDQYAKDRAKYANERAVYLKNKPVPIKRPVSPYIFFFREIRPSLVKEHPTLVATQIIQEVARRWKLLSDQQKVKYQEQFRVAIEKYHKLVPPKPKEPKAIAPKPKKDTKKDAKKDTKKPATKKDTKKDTKKPATKKDAKKDTKKPAAKKDTKKPATKTTPKAK